MAKLKHVFTREGKTVSKKTVEALGPIESRKPTRNQTSPVPVNTTNWASAPKGRILVSPQWVNAVINGTAAATYKNSKYIILEASWGATSNGYKAGHIPGAYHFNTDNIETEANHWNIGPTDHVEDSLKATGITFDTMVIVYANGPQDISGASRVLFALIWAGVRDVRLLDGGLSTWKAAGYATETKKDKPTPVVEFGVAIPQHPEYIITAPQDVLKARQDPRFRLISIRSWDEFTGKTSGYDYIKGAGEPDGAVWGRTVNRGGGDDGYLNADGTFKSFDLIEPMWAEGGITKDTVNSFYCGTGWRATVPWLMAYVQGWKNITLYDGGWYMWEMDKSLPVQIGDPNTK
ncbi:MAG: rhodanese-like domain-containing protein [Chloroflexota bacterium]